MDPCLQHLIRSRCHLGTSSSHAFLAFPGNAVEVAETGFAPLLSALLVLFGASMPTQDLLTRLSCAGTGKPSLNRKA
jgi:hypothetical protein